MDRKKTLLLVLLLIFGLSLTYRVLHPYEQKRVTVLTYTGEKSKPTQKIGLGRRSEQPGADLDVMLDLFVHPPKHSDRTFRNLFVNAAHRPSKPGARESSKAVPKKNPASSSREEMREQINHDLAQFRVFGSYQSKNDMVLFLEKGKEVLLVRRGDRIGGKYLVKEIDGNSIVLKAEGLNEDVHIDLSEF